jgi:hypothetical protein
MKVSDCVDAALTRARQARLPSPWTGRGIWGKNDSLKKIRQPVKLTH